MTPNRTPLCRPAHTTEPTPRLNRAALGQNPKYGNVTFFGSLLGIGISMWFLLQAFINVGTVIGVLPVTGIPLPFVSFGGTSLLVGMAAVGMILNIDRQGQNE